MARRKISEIMSKVARGVRLTRDEREYLSRYLRRVRPGGSGRKRRGRLSISRIMSKVAKGLPLTEREEEALGRYLRRVR
ncbi:MAG TPA: hypothetical protein ENF26_03435 [Methanomicrobia archaeon]|nr:hypothetical protein [Methanomicrobia archaeon]HEX59183.1 hypothetical protein [Methanomicrobia archaeon]